jgi:hypothetical protein
MCYALVLVEFAGDNKTKKGEARDGERKDENRKRKGTKQEK